ncbi:MAG: hypothetical protein ACK5M0_06900 [Bacteroidales bacterium]
MDKNPFSLYDFLGYVIPGSVALMLLWVVLHSPLNSLNDVITIDKDLMDLASYNNIIVFLITSYIIGHASGYISSLTIERFSLWHYSYPSKYLLGKTCPRSEYFDYLKNKNGISIGVCRKILVSIWKILLMIILFPITILTCLIGHFLRLNIFILKPLDPFLRDCVDEKKVILFNTLSLPCVENEEKKEVDHLRLIYHYEYEKNNKQSRKMDNYVALYGFLRSLALIFNLFFIVVLIKSLSTITFNCNDDFSWGLFWLVLLSGSVSYLFYISFLKFYRRYTLECYMSLITDKDLVRDKNKYYYEYSNI